MSLQRTPRAQLPGYTGPYYAPAIAHVAHALHDLYESGRSFCQGDLLHVAQSVPHFQRYLDVRTTDDYIWFLLLEYRVGRHRIVIAIPYMGDRDRQDGCAFDRSPAAYFSTGGGRYASKILLLLAKAIRRY